MKKRIDKRAEALQNFINEVSTSSYTSKDYIDKLHTHFTKIPPRSYRDTGYTAIKALKEIKKCGVPDNYLFDLIRCMELEAMKTVLSGIEGFQQDEDLWGVFLLDKNGNPKIRVEEYELSSHLKWQDTISKKFKKEIKELLKSSE